MQRILSKKVKLVSLTAAALVAVSVATAFAAPVLQPGTTSGPHDSRGTCTDCHSYATVPVVTPPVVTPPVVTPPVVTPPVVTPPVVTPPTADDDDDADEAREHESEKAHKKSRGHKHSKKASHENRNDRSASHRERD